MSGVVNTSKEVGMEALYIGLGVFAFGFARKAIRKFAPNFRFGSEALALAGIGGVMMTRGMPSVRAALMSGTAVELLFILAKYTGISVFE